MKGMQPKQRPRKTKKKMPERMPEKEIEQTNVATMVNVAGEKFADAVTRKDGNGNVEVFVMFQSHQSEREKRAKEPEQSNATCRQQTCVYDRICEVYTHTYV